MAGQGEWQSIEDLERFKETERLRDEIWEAVAEWDSFAAGCGAPANEPKPFSIALSLCDAGATLSSANVVNG